jgi:hypothetical protein
MRNRVLLSLALSFAAAAPLRAQVVPTLRGEGEEMPAIRLSSPAEDLLPHLTLRTPPELRLFVLRPLHSWVAEQMSALQVRLAADERALWRRSLDGFAVVDESELTPNVTPLAVGPVRPDTVAYLPVPLPKDTTKEIDFLPGILSEHADIGFNIRGSGQLGGSWQKYTPCDPTTGIECKPGLFPQLRPDMLFGVVVAGKVADRVNVNVNFDQANEFDAANNLNVSYQGLPNEILQSVEVGDVSIRLPTSRYMTRGIPAGNFGFRATGQLGPLDFQTVFAQQKGDLTTREFKVTGGGSQQSVVQEASVVMDDADYVKGQFFFLVDPATLNGAPYVDPLRLVAQDAPDAVRPRAGGVIQVYRDERLSPSSPNGSELGRFLADALPPGTGVRHSGSFRRLTPDVDYTVHASGLWITLKSPLRPDEALAIAYITETGDTIGDVNAELAPPGQTPQLRLLRGPVSIHQPGTSTWTYEMHNVYRLDTSAGVELNSIDMTISLGDLAGGRTFQVVNGEQLPYVRFFGLDEDSPSERLDEAQIYQPSRGAFGQTGSTISGTFIVFPATQPFMAPGPVPSRGLTAEQLAIELGVNANSAIYNEVDPVNREAAARFKLTFKYRVKADGLASSFSLGAIGIREESESITLGNRRLLRGVDYEIDYDIGQLTLRDPQTLFATNPGAELRAVWEQKPMFQVAPTSVFGLNAKYNVGQRGALNFVGLFQAERSLMARPQLGVEPGSIFLGGVSGSFDLGGALLDRMFGAVPFLRLGNQSAVRLTGEVALSSPNANTKGDAYVEDFESTEEFRIEPRRRDWRLGSRPESNTGDQGLLPFVRDATNAAPIAWTHDYLLNGQPSGAFRASVSVDAGIRIIGSESAEYALHINFGRADMPPVAGPRWRSLTTVISSTGRDMSRSEYLEFYAAAGTEPLSLIVDIGTVSEDAFYVDPNGQTNGHFEDGTEWGLGVLDEEARLAQREVWGTGAGSPDERGLWNQNCLTQPGAVHPFGDPVANCTRNNGLRDTEDLDGNGVLAGTDGEYFRYVVPLDRISEYLVRDRSQTQTNYQLYRIPLRSGVPVNGASDATWRFIKHLRVTVAGETQGVRLVSLARMRVVGSRFTKRDITGVNTGLLDATPSPAVGTIVNAGPVSILTDATYVVPRVNTSAQDPSAGLGGHGAEINEKSLRIAYEQLAPGDRAEVYYRYAQQPRSFMNYRQLHLWAMPRRGTWGVPDGNRFIVKIGTDARNYYLYQTRLHPAPVGDPDTLGGDWLPEVVIDFEQWFALKAEAERRQVTRPITAGVQDTVWSADSTYAIVLEDRARAPNLQAVREISFAVYNGGGSPADGEVWIDDMRLTGAARTTGRATALGLEMNVGEFITGAFTLSHRDDVFQQLNENTPYVASGDFTLNADAHLDRLLPAAWGVDLPLNVSHSRSQQDPTFLQNTDVQASDLGNLRESGAASTRVGLRLSKRTPSANRWLGLLIDGTALRFGYSTADSRAITSRSTSGNIDAGISYSHAVASRSFDVFPTFLENLLRSILPQRAEESQTFARLTASQLRYTPAVISFNSGVQNQMSRTYSYDRILELEDDTITAFESPRQAMQNDVTVNFTPFRGLSSGISLSSSRDLLDPARATEDPQVRAALSNVQSSLAGMNFGWERGRGLNTTLRYEPQLTTWLRGSYDFRNAYSTDRNPSFMSEPTGIDGDTISTMQRRFESGRQTATRLQFRPAEFMNAAFDTAPTNQAGAGRIARGAFKRFESIDFSWTNRLSSQFERESMLPGLAYQLGIGNLESFHVIGADTAARALQSQEFRATGRYAVTRQITMDLTYRATDLDGRDLRGGQRLQHETGWPYLNVRMQDIPLPKSWQKYLLNAVISGGLERVETTSSLGSATTPQERSSNSLNVPVSTTLTFPKGIALFYSGKFKVGDTDDPTGLMRSDEDEHSIRLATIITPPEWLNGKLAEPITTELSFMQRGSYQCRGTILLSTSCIAYVSNTTRTGRFQLRSRMKDLGIGMSVDYNARQSHVGTRNGTSQWTLNLFGDFNLAGGRMPAGFGDQR